MILEDKTITYAHLTHSTETIVKQCLAAAAAVDDEAEKSIHRDFARGAVLLWNRLASRLVAEGDSAGRAQVQQEDARLSALIERNTSVRN